MKDHYKILGVSPASPQDQIKKAYRMLALRHHPDRNGGSGESEELFKQISESYLIIGDISSRKAYDDWRSHQGHSTHERPGQAKATAAVTFLVVFRNIRERVYNAGTTIEGPALFEIINEVLTTENLNYLVQIHDIPTNSLIIDEILLTSVFLDDTSKVILYRKLIRLAHGDAALREKVAVLSNKQHKPGVKPAANDYTSDYEYLFAVFLIILILFGIIMGS